MEGEIGEEVGEHWSAIGTSACSGRVEIQGLLDDRLVGGARRSAVDTLGLDVGDQLAEVALVGGRVQRRAAHGRDARSLREERRNLRGIVQQRMVTRAMGCIECAQCPHLGRKG